MANAPLVERVPGPLERTVLELRRIDRDAVWRRPRTSRTRLLLRESDALVDLVERCRSTGMQRLSSPVWFAVVRFVGGLDGRLRDELGIERRVDHVAEILFLAQELLLDRLREERAPQPARIIPLFG